MFRSIVHNKDFEVSLAYESEDLLPPGVLSPTFARYAVSGLTDASDKYELSTIESSSSLISCFVLFKRFSWYLSPVLSSCFLGIRHEICLLQSRPAFISLLVEAAYFPWIEQMLLLKFLNG